MPHELVAEAKAVQRRAVAEHDRVVERAAAGQAVLPHDAQVLEKAVRARRRELLDERPLGRRPREHLGPDRRVLVVERVADPQRVRWCDLDPAPAAAHSERTRDRQGLPQLGLLRAAGGREQRHERLRAPVQRRDLGAVHLDVQVVDAEPGRGGHEVLDRLDAGAVHPQRRRVVRVDDAVDRRGDPLAGRLDPEHDARIRGTRCERDAGDLTRMEPDTLDADRPANGVLAHKPGSGTATQVPGFREWS